MEPSGGFPCTCTAPPSLVRNAIGKFSYGPSIARGACDIWKVRSALLASLKAEMSRDGSCKSGTVTGTIRCGISAQGGDITPAAWGVPTASERGANQKWPTSGQGGYITPAAWGVTPASERGAESKVAHKWARWLHNPCRLGGPHRFRAGGTIRGGPQVGKVAT